MSEIEKYYNGEIHVDFDDEIEELKADIEEYRDSTTWWSNRFNAVERDNRKLKKVIERLEEDNKKLKECLGIVSPSREFQEGKYWENNEIERLKSIIKEVREYIENGNYRFREGTDICLYQEGNEVFYMENDELMARKILNILDKENKENI